MLIVHNQHFIEIFHSYFNNFILPRPENLYVILARRNEFPDDILNVEICRSMSFVIIVFDIIVQTLVKLEINLITHVETQYFVLHH